MFSVSDFVGLPWEDRGRGPTSYDCWGLFRAAFEAGTGIALPSYADGYSSALDRGETEAMLLGGIADWVEIPRGTERAFDGAVMTLGGRLHIALVVRPGRLLHVQRGASSMIEPITRFPPGLELFRHRMASP